MDVLGGFQIISMTRNIQLVKGKRIGRVLFIVEGLDDEFRILCKIFNEIFGYRFEKLDRNGKHWPKKPFIDDNNNSSVFAINSKQSCITDILRDENGNNEFLDDMHRKLIEEYNFPVDKAAIYYIFDRDVECNTEESIYDLIYKLANSRDEINSEYYKGLLLLSYPSSESFIVSNYKTNSYDVEYRLGKDVKRYLHSLGAGCTIQNITEDTLKVAIEEMLNTIEKMGLQEYDLDNFYEANKFIFEFENNHYKSTNKYKLISLICIALLDLGLINIE